MAVYISLSQNQFNKDGYWQNPLSDDVVLTSNSIELFDQNGYDLSCLEIEYSKVNNDAHSVHRNYSHFALKQPWFTQDVPINGCILNHSLLFERKGYKGLALNQLQQLAKNNLKVWYLIKYKPKWGLDFSMDYIDLDGNVFEILHYEFDGFEYQEIQDKKEFLDNYLQQIDWLHAAKCLLSRKDEWHSLEFFAQSLYKCSYFGIGPERFKMVAWD